MILQGPITIILLIFVLQLFLKNVQNAVTRFISIIWNGMSALVMQKRICRNNRSFKLGYKKPFGRIIFIRRKRSVLLLS